MTPDERNLEEILSCHLPSASQDEAEEACSRIRQRLRPLTAPGRGRTVSIMRRPRTALLAAAASVVLAAIAGIGIASKQHAIATVESIEGTLLQEAEGGSRRLSTGDVIDSGATIRSDGNAGGTLLLTDGSRVEIRSESELSLKRLEDGVRIGLNRGGVIVNAARQQGHLYVQTRDMTVAVVGTVFLVDAANDGSRVAVIEGEVRVTQGTSQRVLKPGEQAATNPRLEPLSVKDELSWSRHAEEHVVLLDRAAPDPADVFESISIASNPGAPDRRLRLRVDVGCEGSVQIGPGRFTASGVSVFQLITLAYSDSIAPWAQDCMTASMLNLVSGGSLFAKTELFDIEASIPPTTPSYTLSQLRGGEAPELQAMLRRLLEQRFNLALRRESRQQTVQVLTVAGDRPHFKADTEIGAKPLPRGILRAFRSGADGVALSTISFRQQTMAQVAYLLAWETNRPFVDRTGIAGLVDFDLVFATGHPDPFLGDRPIDPGTGRPMRYAFSPSLADAFKEHGLRLTSGDELVNVLIIDRVERPSEKQALKQPDHGAYNR